LISVLMVLRSTLVLVQVELHTFLHFGYVKKERKINFLHSISVE